MASQFYLNSFRYPGKYLNNFGVKDRDTLRMYDPDIGSLLDEVHSCVPAAGNSDTEMPMEQYGLYTISNLWNFPGKIIHHCNKSHKYQYTVEVALLFL